ncbi:MAG: transglutaminaseTgpA domain-containing protein [Anaerolineae bacterium]
MIGWLVKRLRLWEGEDTFIPLLAVVLCLPAAVDNAAWVPDDGGLFPLAFFALLLGRWLALQRSWKWDVWILLGVPSGLLASLSVAAHTLPVPPWSSNKVSDFAMRWLAWLEAAVSGGTNDDPDIFLFYVALLCWLVVLLVAWAFYHRRRPLLSLLLSVVPTALVVFYSKQGVGWLVGELGCGIVLLAIGNLVRAQHTWEAMGVDYAPSLNFDVLMVAGAIAAVVALFSLFGPQFSVRRLSDWFWRTFKDPSTQVEDTMDRLFGGVLLSGERPGTGAGAGASSYMPQSHLLGGRPELLDEVVMIVQTDEMPSLPPVSVSIPERQVPLHYWQGITLDHYSGRGWVTRVDFRENVEGELPLPAPPDYREVTQYFEFTSYHGDTLYALNVPSWVGDSVEAVWYGPGDLARLASEVTSYTVVSRLPEPTANDLRVVPPIYSNAIRERYLQLPETVPTRVIELAQEVVSEGETVYEQARLLERYLRGYPYSLDVEQAPKGWDVADYFLFGVREGYCDYYATAFVVMARAVGIPARLASGYVEGRYDPISNAYLVYENAAHSWPEVYFPGWGWIRFEPTASRTVTELREEVALPEMAVPEPTGPPARVVRARWRRIGFWTATLVGVWLVVTLRLYYRRRRAARVVTLSLVWDWVGRGGARLGLPPDLTLTPQEYAAILAIELRVRAERTQRWQSRWIKLAKQGGAALERLATLHTLHTYGGQRVAAMDENTARDIWERLSRPLRWFRWLGWVQ